MAKVLIPPERFIELANSAIEGQRHFQPGMRMSLGANLPNGSYEIEYHGAGTKRVAVEARESPSQAAHQPDNDVRSSRLVCCCSPVDIRFAVLMVLCS
jgi:hypothetical protein